MADQSFFDSHIPDSIGVQSAVSEINRAQIKDTLKNQDIQRVYSEKEMKKELEDTVNSSLSQPGVKNSAVHMEALDILVGSNDINKIEIRN